jgi:hypothetical protein
VFVGDLPFRSSVQVASEMLEQHLHIYYFYAYLISDVPASELMEYSWQVVLSMMHTRYLMKIQADHR